MTEPTHNGRPIVKERQTRPGALRHRQGGLRHVAGGPRGREDPRRPHARGVGLHRPSRRWRRSSRSPSWRTSGTTRRRRFPWSLNPDFVELVEERFSPDDTLLVTCRSGGRGAMAINMLATAGFTNAYNILDGMEGSTGQRSRQRLRRHAPQERLADVRPAVDVRPRPGRGWRSPSASPERSIPATPRTDGRSGAVGERCRPSHGGTDS